MINFISLFSFIFPKYFYVTILRVLWEMYQLLIIEYIHVNSNINYHIDCRKHICAACRYMISLDLSCSRLSAAFLLRQKKMRFHTPSFSHHLSSLHNLLQQSAVERSKVTREELILRFSFYRNLRKIWQLSSKFHRWDRKFRYHVLVHIDIYIHTYTYTHQCFKIVTL